MKRVLPIGVLLLAVSQTGCGTVANCRNGLENATPYGGVKIAAGWFKPGVKNCGFPPVFGLPFYAADVVGSAVADTLLLPVTWSLGIAHGLKVDYSAPIEHPNEWRRFWVTEQPEPPIPGGIW